MSVKYRVSKRKPDRRKALLSILPASSYFKSAFLDWITQYCTSDACVLDIGAGKDKNQIDASIQPRVMRLVGIDLSEDILFNQSVHERYQISLENFASGTHEKFDILVCTMVLEHVANPDAFFSACRHLLKPGGCFFAVTPNMW